RRDITRRRRTDRDRHDAVRDESARYLLNANQTANGETGGDQKDERQRDFAGDQQSTQAALALADRYARRLFAIVVKIDAAQLPRRRDTEQDADKRRDSQAEEQHRAIGADVSRDRQI